MFEWKDEFKTEVVEIDNQHRRLLEIGRELYSMLKINDGADHYDEINEILDELTNYTVYHFAYEEKLMEENGYKDLDAHKEKHKAFVNKVTELRNQDIDENQSEFMMTVATFLADWTAEHILKVDSDYKILFKLKGLTE